MEAPRMNAPTLCSACLTENRIATVNGPTCPHQVETGAAWWPSWWMIRGAEVCRLNWLNSKRGSAPRP